ncbi:MAG TPA: GntR family transcriptional regulator [Bacillaceae bacterium]
MPVPANHLRPKRKSAKESAYTQLQQWIIDGTLYPGEKLNDTELAQALGVSRTPIREALQLLETQGFVKMYPGKATQVTEVEKEEIEELLPPLAALQALAAELATPFMTEEVLAQLTETNKRFAQAVRSENDFNALKIDEEFHQLIVDAANNPYIQTIVEGLQAHVRRQFFHHSIVLSEKSIAEHEDIIEFMRSNKPEKASVKMKENWIRTLEEFHKPDAES